MAKRTVIDLGAGLGGLSEAFHQSPAWDLHRVDIDPALSDVPGMVLWDYTDPGSRPDCLRESYDLVLAGPECVEFSLGYNSPRVRAQRAGESYSPNMTQIQSVLRFIDLASPTWWLIENVIGSIKYLTKTCGTPQIIGSRVMYGTVPSILMTRDQVEAMPNKTEMSGYHARSLVPLPLSHAILEAVEQQTLLTEWVVDGDEEGRQ